MRRILRKIVAGEGDQLGDLSSIADPSIVDESESFGRQTESLLTLCSQEQGRRKQVKGAHVEFQCAV